MTRAIAFVGAAVLMAIMAVGLGNSLKTLEIRHQQQLAQALNQ